MNDFHFPYTTTTLGGLGSTSGQREPGGSEPAKKRLHVFHVQIRQQTNKPPTPPLLTRTFQQSRHVLGHHNQSQFTLAEALVVAIVSLPVHIDEVKVAVSVRLRRHVDYPCVFRSLHIRQEHVREHEVAEIVDLQMFFQAVLRSCVRMENNSGVVDEYVDYDVAWKRP